MTTTTLKPVKVQDRPADRLKRRMGVSDATAAAIVEIAFADRIRTLGDKGLTLDAAFLEAAR